MKPEMDGCCIIDASALLALFFNEPGAETVQTFIRRAPGIVTLVNYCEVLTKLYDVGCRIDEFDATFYKMPLTLVDINEEMARYAAALRPATKHAGLSLGDRFCLACTFYYRGTAVTADRSWKEIKSGVPICYIR